MITIKNEQQIDKMRQAGRLLHQILWRVVEEIRPGISTLYLDAVAERLIREAGAEPSFLGYEGYPNTLCTSIDDQVVHGIPSDRQILQEGQIISLDCGLSLDGWQADSALTAVVGRVAPELYRLCDATDRAFWAGARQAVAGNHLGDIGHAIMASAEQEGYHVIRDLTGHGIGRELHEDPTVWHYGLPGHGAELRPGMTICIEPMLTAGDWHVDQDDDGWCFRTRDHSPTSHYEHTLLIREGLPEILTLPNHSW